MTFTGLHEKHAIYNAPFIKFGQVLKMNKVSLQ